MMGYELTGINDGLRTNTSPASPGISKHSGFLMVHVQYANMFLAIIPIFSSTFHDWQKLAVFLLGH